MITKTEIKEVLFSMNYLSKTNWKLNWNNWPMWKKWLNNKYHQVKNIFVVDRWYLVQADGKRRLRTKLFGPPW